MNMQQGMSAGSSTEHRQILEAERRLYEAQIAGDVERLRPLLSAEF